MTLPLPTVHPPEGFKRGPLPVRSAWREAKGEVTAPPSCREMERRRSLGTALDAEEEVLAEEELLEEEEDDR